MSTFIYQDVICLIMRLSIWRNPSLFMNVAIWGHYTLEN